MTERQQNHIGGYCYQFVNADNVPAKYRCLVCNLPSREPHQVSCCGNVYCHSCLDQLRRDDSHEFTCQAPTCHNDLTNRYFPDVRADKEIHLLRIYCTNKDDGCLWEGSITDLAEHLHMCEKQKVLCTNECEQLFRRCELADHLANDCPKRNSECRHCGNEGTYHFLTGEHLKECLERPVPCSNEECNILVKQGDMLNHRAVCPREIVRCPYADIGCSMPLFREQVERHGRSQMERHLQLARDRIVSLEKYNAIAPLKIKLDNCFARRAANDKWYSPGFYTSPGGYKMCLNVHSNGTGKGRGTHLSCFVCLMPGEYDDTLEWPFKGEVTIELLNQLENKNHHSITTHPILCIPRMAGKLYGDGWGEPEFIEHSSLRLNPTRSCHYLKDDSLYFRVAVNVQSKTKPWLTEHSL